MHFTFNRNWHNTSPVGLIIHCYHVPTKLGTYIITPSCFTMFIGFLWVTEFAGFSGHTICTSFTPFSWFTHFISFTTLTSFNKFICLLVWLISRFYPLFWIHQFNHFFIVTLLLAFHDVLVLPIHCVTFFVLFNYIF